MKQITIYSDGGARGNPGPAGIGIVIRQGDKETKRISKFIGVATNNQAEYKAVIEALKWILINYPNHLAPAPGAGLEVEFFLDSQLVVEQLNGRYKLKNEGLKPLFWQVRELVMKVGGRVSFKFIPREQNKIADKLVNQAIDKAVK